MLRKALLTFERTGGWFEDTAANHAAYAKLLYRAGRITDAVLAARRSVILNEGDYETWNFIAAMQLQVGNLEHAEQAYGHSLTARPDQPEIEKQRRQIIDELTRRNMNQKP
jgi:cytochrome c-type biogenesis protein CcmH/NrfG